MKQISSRDNAHFKELRKLCQSGRERRPGKIPNAKSERRLSAVANKQS